jgi:hypothetical protein
MLIEYKDLKPDTLRRSRYQKKNNWDSEEIHIVFLLIIYNLPWSYGS